MKVIRELIRYLAEQKLLDETDLEYLEQNGFYAKPQTYEYWDSDFYVKGSREDRSDWELFFLEESLNGRRKRKGRKASKTLRKKRKCKAPAHFKPRLRQKKSGKGQGIEKPRPAGFIVPSSLIELMLQDTLIRNTDGLKALEGREYDGSETLLGDFGAALLPASLQDWRTEILAYCRVRPAKSRRVVYFEKPGRQLTEHTYRMLKRRNGIFEEAGSLWTLDENFERIQVTDMYRRLIFDFELIKKMAHRRRYSI